MSGANFGDNAPDLGGHFDHANSPDQDFDHELEYDAADWPELDDHYDLSELYPSPGGTLEESVHTQLSQGKREAYEREALSDMSKLKDEQVLDFDEQFQQAAADNRPPRDTPSPMREEFHEMAESDLTPAEIRQLIEQGRERLGREFDQYERERGHEDNLER